jgi:ribosomal protein L31
VTSLVKDKSAKLNFTNSTAFKNQVNICHDRFNRGDKRMTETSDEVAKLAKRFERFIVYSDLEPDKKAKILNGD